MPLTTTIGRALTDSGDILLYGCNVAAGDAGQSFIEALAQYTRADIAASTDLTGASSLRGDWVLEASTNPIEQSGTSLVSLGDGYAYALSPGLFLIGTEFDDTIHGSVNDDQLLGLDGNDWLYGDAGNDSLEGGGGHDYLDGGTGDDSVDGGDGDDRVGGGAGNDTLVGGLGDDELSDGYGANFVSGGSGNDRFYVAGYTGDLFAKNTFVGGEGSDTFFIGLTYWHVNDVVTDFTIGVGGDRIDVSSALLSASLWGYEGGNPFASDNGFFRVIQTTSGAQLQFDRDGTANGSEWITVLLLEGVDSQFLSADNFVDNISPDGSDVSGLQTYGTDSNETLSGGWFNDQLNGMGGNDVMWGKGGADTLAGGIGDDTLDGGPGDDLLLGADGNDYLHGFNGDDTLKGGDGNDWFFDGYGLDSFEGGAGDDVFHIDPKNIPSSAISVVGGEGQDTYLLQGPGPNYSFNYFLSNAVATDFATGTTGDLIDLEILVSYDWYAEYTSGNPFDPTLGFFRLLQAGTDTLVQYDRDGAVGSNFDWYTLLTLQGVDKNAVSTANVAKNLPPDGSAIEGQVITYSGLGSVEGGWGDDHISTTWAAALYGNGGNDTLVGGDGPDFLHGGPGHDLLIGGPGDDRLVGVQGNDTLIGGDGNDGFGTGGWPLMGMDSLDGGAGSDVFNLTFFSRGAVTITGGAGQDTVLLNGFDYGYSSFGSDAVVSDFAGGVGGDLIDVHELLRSDFGGAPLANAFSGGNPFDASLGYLQLVQLADDTFVQYDRDGAQGAAHAWITALTLRSVRKGDITSDNFVGQLIVGTPGNDTLIGGVGDDTIQGLAGDDALDGSVGADSLEGGPGNDTYYVDNAGDVVVELGGLGLGLALLADGAPLQGVTDTVVAAINYSLAGVASVENLALSNDSTASESGTLPTEGTGNDLDNVLIGNSLDNIIKGLGGRDSLDGGSGTDAAVFRGSLSQYRLLSVAGFTYVADTVTLRDGLDRLVSIENLQFEGSGATVTPGALKPFSGSEYIASYADLMNGFGANAGAGLSHYINWGSLEGRQVSFNGLAYIASYPDLINALGASADTGAAHYIQWGRNEGRTTSFDALGYIASYRDLIDAFGADADAGASHYIGYGRNEGRQASFDGLAYIASYADLINAYGADGKGGTEHYINWGYAEGRQTTFDGLAYIASYGDLINALGPNAHAGASHYLEYGRNEGRATTFSGLQYIASYTDLINAFGADAHAGADHYVRYGYAEGRQSTFDGLEYIASYGDLISAFGANATAGASHYISFGLKEGRTEHFDAVQYLANYADLQAAFGSDTHLATLHFIQYGYAEGRTDQPTT